VRGNEIGTGRETGNGGKDGITGLKKEGANFGGKAVGDPRDSVRNAAEDLWGMKVLNAMNAMRGMKGMKGMRATKVTKGMKDTGADEK
jgi:hypothetical protein